MFMSSHRRRRSSGYGGVVRRVRRPKRIAKTYANLHLHGVHITDLIETVRALVQVIPVSV